MLVAIRLIRIKLRVTRVEPPPEHEYEDGDDKPDPDFSNFKGQRLPIVHFAGDSRSLHASWDPNANSKIRGRPAHHPSPASPTFTSVLTSPSSQAPSDKPPKAKSAGRPSPFSTARSVGGPRAFRSEGSSPREVCWATGSIRISMSMGLRARRRFGKRVIGLRRDGGVMVVLWRSFNGVGRVV